MEEIERCLLVKPEVLVYKIPPRQSSRGYRAADWNLADPSWTGRLRFVTKGRYCEIRLEDKNSGELFAACPIERYPGTSIESVMDSSRYFVLCIQDSGRKAYIGIGFSDRSDSFDLNVALQDHFKWLKKEDNPEESLPQPSLDLALKDGQTFRVNINIPKKEKDSKPKPKTGFDILNQPPPRIAPPPGATPVQTPTEPVITENNDPWGDFATSGTSVQPSGNWVQF